MFVVRAFVHLRDPARTHVELARHLAAIERRVTLHDADLQGVFAALRRLMAVLAVALPLRRGHSAASSEGSIRRFRVSHSDSLPGSEVRLAKAHLW